MNLIFLDTETTGNEIGKDRLCQVCYKVGPVMKNEYFKPPVPISVKAMSITHITNKMIQDKKPFIGSEMHNDLKNLLEDGILVAHNAKFDISMLEAEGLSTNKFICTLRMARYLDPRNAIPEYNLQYLRYLLDIEVTGDPHNAETDVKVLVAIFDRLFLKMKESLGGDDEIIKKMIEVSSVPSIFSYFNFGKYKDQKVEDVSKSDRGYLEWLLNTKMQNEKNDEDWIYTLRHYLSK